MSTLAIEDERALSILRRIDYSPTDRKRLVAAVTVLGSDLYALAVELSGSPDGPDEEWLTSGLLMRTEAELLRRVGGWVNMTGYVDALMVGKVRS